MLRTSAEAAPAVRGADCFYAQVEQLRLNIPRETPCAVQQWEGLIAVNYAARAAGITRHMKAPEALVKCPGLQLVHVQTLGGGVPDADGASTEVPSEDAPARGGEGNQGTADRAEQQAGSRDREKACLERYREASGKIIGLLREKAPQVRVLSLRAVHAVLGHAEEHEGSGCHPHLLGCLQNSLQRNARYGPKPQAPGRLRMVNMLSRAQATVEKASIDEVYVDVTSLVDAELRRPQDDAGHVAPQAEHSSQDDGEAEAEEEAHAATRSAPVRRTGTRHTAYY